MSWSPIPEMMWRIDPEVTAARRMPTWNAFHRACGLQQLYFDHIERTGGRRGDFRACAFTLIRRRTYAEYRLVHEGRAKTVVGALAAAFEGALAAGYSVPDAEPLLAALLNPDAPAPAAAAIEAFDDILGGGDAAELSMEDLLG